MLTHRLYTLSNPVDPIFIWCGYLHFTMARWHEIVCKDSKPTRAQQTYLVKKSKHISYLQPPKLVFCLEVVKFQRG